MKWIGFIGVIGICIYLLYDGWKTYKQDGNLLGAICIDLLAVSNISLFLWLILRD